MQCILQDLHRRCPGQISVQDILKRFPGNTFFKNPVPLFICKNFVGKISVKDSRQVLVGSHDEPSLQDQQNLRCEDLGARSAWPASIIKMSTAQQREQPDTRKVPSGWREPSQNECRTAARAIWQAQSARRLRESLMAKFSFHRGFNYWWRMV